MKSIHSFLFICCLFFSLPALAAQVDTLEVYSAAMDKKLKAAVVLPESYQANNKAYPVVYLLHGGSGTFSDWLKKTPDKSLLHRMADQFDFIFVTPEAGPTTYYFDSPVDKSSQYETFISKEVVEKIDNTYRTIKERKGRVIAGLSMGGHGAFFIAARHPELYAAAGSMSGVMNINTASWKVPEDFAKSRSKNFESLLGPPKEGEHPYPEYTAVGLADQMKVNDVKLIFDCGVDDFLIDTNRQMHSLLLANGTPHDYIERPGGHSWEYWENALPYQLLFFHKVLKENGAL